MRTVFQRELEWMKQRRHLEEIKRQIRFCKLRHENNVKRRGPIIPLGEIPNGSSELLRWPKRNYSVSTMSDDNLVDIVSPLQMSKCVLEQSDQNQHISFPAFNEHERKYNQFPKSELEPEVKAELPLLSVKQTPKTLNSKTKINIKQLVLQYGLILLGIFLVFLQMLK